MSVHHTCVNTIAGKKPTRLVLHGDPAKPEPGTHIIEFPGGAIELARLDDGSYWAHIIVNRRQALPIFDGRENALGVVVDSRIDWAERSGTAIPSLPDQGNLTQLAVRIVPERPWESADAR